MQAKVRSKPLVLPVRIPEEMRERLDRAVSKLQYSSRGEFVREAIAEHLGSVEEQIVETKDVSVAEAARLMDGYLTENPGAHYVSDLAESLGLELSVAFQAAKELKAKGVARERRR